MSEIGFPNQIEVVAGAGWLGVLTPDETIVLDKVNGQLWTESGASFPSSTNRIAFFIGSSNACVTICLDDYGQFNRAARQGSARSSNNDYTFLNIWNGGLTAESWSCQVATSATYNPDVFSLMREYAPSATGNPKSPLGGIAFDGPFRRVVFP